MFEMSIVAQQGMKFNANLFKDKQVIGGIGGDEEGMFINISAPLTLEESYQLLAFAKGVHPLFLSLPISIEYGK